MVGGQTRFSMRVWGISFKKREGAAEMVWPKSRRERAEISQR